MDFLSGWKKRKFKTINGSTVGAQTNYQLKITIFKGAGVDTNTTLYCNNNCNDNFSDIRFTKSDGTTLLDYWIESTVVGTSAIIWVEVDNIPVSPDTVNIYVYYNNPSAPSLSNIVTTFIRTVAGLIAAWTLDGNPTDTSGNGNDLTPNGGAGYAAGKFGLAGNFDGIDDAFTVPDNSLWDFAGNNFTLTAWINSTYTQNMAVFGQGTNNTNAAYYLYINFPADGIVHTQIYSANIPIIELTSSAGDIVTGTWYHIALRRNGNTWNIYKNGNSIATTNDADAIPNQTSKFYVGANNAIEENPFRLWKGLIQNVRFYNLAVSNAELLDLANNYGYTTLNFTGSEIVRKFVSPEPLFSATGTEESLLTTVLGSLYSPIGRGITPPTGVICGRKRTKDR